MTTVATVTCKYVNNPKPGKTFGSIKTPDNTLYWVNTKDVALPVQGSTIAIEYEEQSWGGKPALVVTAIKQPSGVPAANGHAPQHSNTALIDAKRMYVTGIVGRALGSGQFGATDIGLLTKAACQAFEESFGEKAEAEAPF